ncbi:transcription elongation factor SPT6-like [Temnothorax curvispinosus]|uniref:Transcription elongation factor SPT6-like n=1 Tax=Temnothorax curvispinosus TaxID=300111 RepID=A0A6J1PLT5_9HYME|nr:transcription elongation factor SPT6-like [Temnothorax curvispinosus]
MFGRVSDLLRWFKEHFRDPVPGQSTPSTPRGAMTSRTPYTTTPGRVSGMNQEAIQRVAQNLPHHMLHSLSQVANQTPHHYPPHTPGAASATGYGGVHTYLNTPYTPSGQTPFMTAYQTPHHTPHHGQPTPRYGQQTPSHHQGPFVHPPPPSMTPSHHRSAQSHRPTPPLSTPFGDPTDWKKAAEDWAARIKSGSRVSGSTPRYEESRRTPRNYDEPVGRTTPSGRSRPSSTRTPSYRSPRGTPHTNSSPRSMSLSGDGTPLYDES